ncbi:5-oxoprolinase subunit PxpB [Mesobacillus subterraneus]|uniref:5-oxoprolinase subunit PxpB n=1 Tax=Mesobacillus subterraneus TaxID=285983 RepID=A0A427TQH0_9BACI|nr:5-oxoprolinase subunit PxpB [Mesobacillus subterraneus]RSD26643.1 5-oxoprolinase subunit PxpB [Mesobacillus subterraneus]
MKLDILPLGDLAIVISFGDVIADRTNVQIRQFMKKLDYANIKGIVEWVPAYTSLTVYYEPDILPYESLVAELNKVHLRNEHSLDSTSIVNEIPVCYGGKWGQDLGFVADHHGMPEQEVINLHANREYLIYMMGFMPGFPYLGGLPEKLAVPRLEKPRESVVPGSVGIGGNQTGIYPSDVPSGWRIIGTTPVTLFAPEKAEPFLVRSGHYIKFIPIDEEQFLAIKQMGDAYQVKKYEKEG